MWAVYYRNKKLTPGTPVKEVAEADMKRLSFTFKNLKVKVVKW